MIKNKVKVLLILAAAVLVQCASMRTAVDFHEPVAKDLKSENYSQAINKIDAAKKDGKYTEKDRVVYYLDKGAAQYYNGEFQKSIDNLSKAELAMEELFTKSVSKAALSFVLNDNALDYFGEIYENLYVNIFMALNYLKLNKFDDAYVEIKRVNDKLRELDDKFGQYAKEMNEADDSHDNMKYEATNFYNDALAGYLSYLIFRAEGEEDNSRISFNKMKEAWNTQPQVYKYSFPSNTIFRKPYYESGQKNSQKPKTYLLNVIAFTGQGPFKMAVGGKITTYKNYIGISNVSVPLTLPNIFFPGMEPGYHFKFAFPSLLMNPSQVKRVEVFIDGHRAGGLELLEKMGNVAEHTFESNRAMIVVKTLLRTVVKGIAAAQAKEKLRKETKANGFMGFLMDAAVDVAVDATENPDLRCWRTMPQNCYVGEFEVPQGKHDVEIRFIGSGGAVLSKKIAANYEFKSDLNLIDAVSLK